MRDLDPSCSMRASFSAAASTYDDHADFQAGAARRLLDILSPLPEPECLLEVGSGTGQLTRLLAARYPRAWIDAVDMAPGMVEQARKNLEGMARIRWFVDDARRFDAGRRYPLIVSNCSLHWLEPLERSLRHLARLVEEGGSLAASVMLDGTLAELHAARRSVAPGKIPPGRLPTLEILKQGLERAGMIAEVIEAEETMAACPSVELLLEQLRRQGLTGGPVSRASLPLNRGEVRRLVEAYQVEYAVPGGVRVTYRTGYFRARLTPSSRRSAGSDPSRDRTTSRSSRPASA